MFSICIFRILSIFIGADSLEFFRCTASLFVQSQWDFAPFSVGLNSGDSKSLANLRFFLSTNNRREIQVLCRFILISIDYTTLIRDTRWSLIFGANIQQYIDGSDYWAQVNELKLERKSNESFWISMSGERFTHSSSYVVSRCWSSILFCRSSYIDYATMLQTKETSTNISRSSCNRY